MVNEALYGGIEAGGTKFVCLIANDRQDIYDEIRLSTTTPSETLEEVIRFFKEQPSDRQVSAVGIGSFGPLELDTTSRDYGSIKITPKAGWEDTNILEWISERLQVPAAIDTDVNAAALGEYLWGWEQQFDPLLYLTIGTGIGGGCIVEGHPIHGLSHPEMGHLLIPHNQVKDPFAGCCPFHQDCFEGLAAGPAIQERWGKTGEELPGNHPAWELEADYIAVALVNFILSLSPNKIILGGGVMQQEALFPMIRVRVIEQLRGYLQSNAILDTESDYISPPALGNHSGVLGAVALAMGEEVVRA
jgi:fructokinase